MVGRTTRTERATSNTNSASFISPRTIPLPKDKDEGYQPVVNSISVPPSTGARSHYPYGPSDVTTPALISDSGMGSSTQSLPSTITPLRLLRPTLQGFSPSPEKNTDGRYSAAAKGKGKALTEDLFFLDDEDLLYPSDFSSTAEWVAHTRPILQDYANRQIPLPLGRRVNVSLNKPSQFIQGALQLLANRDHPQKSPIDVSRQLGPQLIENFTDVHKWATEYFRMRFGMSTVGSDIPVLLTIITNTFYEAHTHLIDSIIDAALDNMRGRGAASLDIEDFAFGYDFEMSQQLPFAVESSHLIYDTLEQHRPRSPLELPVNLPVTTRYGRQIKMTKQAQAAAFDKREKQTAARQRKKERAKKDRDLTTPRHEMYEAVSQVTKKNATTSSASAVVCSPSDSIYRARNNGSLSHTPLHGIRGISRKEEANAVMFTGAKCPTCRTVMPPRTSMTPTNIHSASQSIANSKISNNLNSGSNRAITESTASSNLRLASVFAQHPPLAVPSPIGFPPSASAWDTAGRANTTGTLSEATTCTQATAQAQVPARGGRLYLYARGARGNRGDRRGRGRGGGASAPLTTVTPARPHPVALVSPAVPSASASTAIIAPTNAGRRDPSGKSASGSRTTSTHTANVPTIAASSKKHVPPKGVRPGSVNTTSGASYKIATAGSNANAGVDNTANSHVYASVPSGISTLGTIGPTSTRAYCPPSTTVTAASTTVNAVAGPSRDRAIDFTDPEFWTKHAHSTCDSPGFAAQVPNSSARPAVATSSNRVHTAVASSSQVDTRKTKKRKLDDSK